MLDRGAETQLYGAVRQRFDDLVRRASHLSVPGTCKRCDEPISRMSLTFQPGGGLAVVDFFCASCQHEGGSTSVLVTPAFYAPELFKPYDKSGAKVLVGAIKLAYFGSKSYRMTQTTMEEFFDDPVNFVDYELSPPRAQGSTGGMRATTKG
jgi:hypothetical protein